MSTEPLDPQPADPDVTPPEPLTEPETEPLDPQPADPDAEPDDGDDDDTA
jgi:hypothetical protein